MDETKLSAIAQKLWNADANKVVHRKDFEIDLQSINMEKETLFFLS